jgi:tetratricopeptide (TPR) repeat protein
MTGPAKQVSPRLERLIGFLRQDPANIALLTETVELALSEGQPVLAGHLLATSAGKTPLPPSLVNLQGIAALAAGEFAKASDAFEALRDEGQDDPAIRFNLAWAKAMTGDFVATHDLLDDAAVAAAPQGPALKIEAMHHLELYEDALAVGQGLAERYPDNTALMGALAMLAMDAEEVELARHYAERSGDHPQGLTVRGLFALDAQRGDDAMALFDQALARQPGNPRAWIGRGLGLLARGDARAAANALDRGAAMFEDHLGSWIAAGWAHYIGGDMDKAQAAFERALAIDPNFSESHGGLAVMALHGGDIATAERHAEIALRLDRRSFGGALAKSLLLDRSGKGEAAQRIRDIALNTPIGPDGKTITQALVGMGLNR